MQNLESLQDIFEGKILRIPDYQRGFAWGNVQTNDFWEDVINLRSDRSHYTGMLSIKLVNEDVFSAWEDEKWIIKGKSLKPYHVVDGQQRLTTCIIFIQEIVNFTKKLDENSDKSNDEVWLGEFSLKEIEEKFICVKSKDKVATAYLFGYEKDNPSFEYLKKKILGASAMEIIEETYYTKNLELAQLFFRKALAEFYVEFGMKGIEQLFLKTTQKLKFNIHYIDDDFDVYVAFETINNRGKKLSNLELLKSRLIYLTSLFDDKILPPENKMVLRTTINDAWRAVYGQLGRNKDKPLNDDEFLKAHWMINYQFTNKTGNDYKDFLLGKKFTTNNLFGYKIVEDSSEDIDVNDEEITIDKSDALQEIEGLLPRDIDDYVKTLKTTVKYWYATFYPNESDALTKNEKIWIDRLNRIGIAYFRPLVVATFLVDNTEKERIDLFKEIERFIFIAFRLNGAYQTYNASVINTLVRKVSIGEKKLAEVRKVIHDRLENWISPSTNYKSSGFKEKIKRLFTEGGGYYDWSSIKYFLYEYEFELQQGKAADKIILDHFIRDERDKVSVEHIYPQTPIDKYWVNAFSKYSSEHKKALSGSLGNLLPLSMSINSSLQNDNFLNKKREKINSDGSIARRGYSNGSHSEIEVANLYKDWNAETILDRGMSLLSFMEKRWDIKFSDEETKRDLLALSFIKKRKSKISI